jgi:hypothetical protein
MKTLKDIESAWTYNNAISHLDVDSKILRELAKEWRDEIIDITDNYCENGGDLTDDGVIAIIKKRHPEWIAFMEDWCDDDLSRLYFLTEWIEYFFNLEE